MTLNRDTYSAIKADGTHMVIENNLYSSISAFILLFITNGFITFLIRD